MGIMPDYDVSAGIQQELAEIGRHVYFSAVWTKEALVVIGDNSGEIVFDYLLLAHLKNFSKELYYVVKGGPILNDATIDDAEEAGMHLLAEVVTTGNSYLGVVPELCDEKLSSLMRSAGMILAKGQANYETLEGTSFAGERAFFLLRAKFGGCGS